jgi:hypothetical protein
MLAGHSRQVDGNPPHAPLQQSSFELQPLPGPRHIAAHTGIPCESGVHVPRQQSESMTHGLDVSRQPPGPSPGPTSQRPVGSHTPEQQSEPASPLHASPLGKHASEVATQRSAASHRPEQHPLSSAHMPPTTLQMAPPHWPPLQASEQQSCASSQGAPLLSQYAPHEGAPPRGPCMQRSVQHCVPYSHAAPGGAHVPEGRQYESSQRAEQQSPGPLQYCPLERQVGPASLVDEQGAPSLAGIPPASPETASAEAASSADASRVAASAAGALPKSTSSPHAAATAPTTITAIAEASGREAI